MFELTVTIYGETASDLEMGIEEVSRLVSEGYQSGSNANDTGEFFFSTKEQEQAQ